MKPPSKIEYVPARPTLLIDELSHDGVSFHRQDGRSHAAARVGDLGDPTG